MCINVYLDCFKDVRVIKGPDQIYSSTYFILFSEDSFQNPINPINMISPSSINVFCL